MDKKKAVICTILFGIIITAIFVASLLINSEHGFTLYDVFSPIIVGAWMGGKTKKFYDWLTKWISR